MTTSSTMLHPLVSIAMCTYNGEVFLREQLDSLITQDYPNLEIIIVDDLSTDSTFSIVQEYAAKYSYIRAIQNEVNLGFVRNFEKTISLCSGEYISLCDQDDIWFPHKISTLVNHINDASLIYTNVEIINNEGTPSGHNFFKRRNLTPVEGRCGLSLIFENCILGHSVLFKRNLLKNILPIPQNIPAHDQWISIITGTIGLIKYHNQILSLYREHQNNVSLKNKDTGRSISESIHRKWRRKKTIIKKNEKMQSLLTALIEKNIFLKEEQQLLLEISKSYQLIYRTIFRNRKLYTILKKEEKVLFAICQNREKSLRKISRGYISSILR